jgi:hypothetical protein
MAGIISVVKISKGRTYNPKNFMGRGVNSLESGVTPNEAPGPMGMNYGLGVKNPMGKMRSDSIGYIPVTKDKLSKGPTQVV